MAPTTKSRPATNTVDPDAPVAVDGELLTAMAAHQEAGTTQSLLAWKTAAVMAGVSRVKKSGWNDAQKYAFAQEGDIADMVRLLLAQYRVGFHGSLINVTREPITSKGGTHGTLATVRMQFTLTCADTGEVEESYWEGDATDWQDKAVPKAITACKKSWLIFRFLISTGDLAEADAAGEEFTRAGGYSTQPPATTTTPAGPDTRKVTKAQVGRIFGLARTVPFLVDHTEGGGGVDSAALHTFVRWVLHKRTPPPPVESLNDLTRDEVEQVFRWMERAAASPEAAGQAWAMVDEWATGMSDNDPGDAPTNDPESATDAPPFAEGYEG